MALGDIPVYVVPHYHPLMLAPLSMRLKCSPIYVTDREYVALKEAIDSANKVGAGTPGGDE
jgi:hypothetical protein